MAAPVHFPHGISHFDVHVYFCQSSKRSVACAEQLRQETMRTFPKLRVYELVTRPIGPHPVGMFEIHLTTPEEFGTYVPWLAVKRGELSALVHPHTDDAVLDHTHHAVWLGPPYPLITDILKPS